MAEVAEARVAKIDGLDFEIAVIPVAKIDPNPWNPNRMDDRTLQAERESIQRFGFIDPVTVRAHPQKKGRFQIIDGEHRWRLAGELEMEEIPCAVLRDCSDTMAKKLTIVLNETQGEPDSVLLGTLLAELQQEEGEALGEALRYGESEMGHLIDLAAEEDWAGYEAGGMEEPAPDGGEEETDFWTLQARLPEEAREIFDAAKEKAGKGKKLDPAEKVAAGQVVLLALRAYLR